MSYSEDERPEQRSKIKVSRNAKADAQWEVTVVAGESTETLDVMRQQAVDQYRALQAELTT